MKPFTLIPATTCDGSKLHCVTVIQKDVLNDFAFMIIRVNLQLTGLTCFDIICSGISEYS